MVIDQTDLSLIRAIEWGGIITHNSRIRSLKLEPEEITRRLLRLRKEGLLRGYKATIFVPPFMGGKWVWGCALIQTRSPQFVAREVGKKIAHVTEAVFNTSLPSGLGPNLSILFYATNFDDVKKFLSEVPEIGYVEVYQVGKYEFALAQQFSADEAKLLRAIAVQPDADKEVLAALTKQPLDWVKAKLDALVWDPENAKGVILVLPEMDWRKAENFMHVHFLLELSVSVKSVSEELSKRGFKLVLDGQLFRNKYLQFETDIWGFSDLLAKKEVLDGISGIHLTGLLIAQENTVVSDWVNRSLAAIG